MYHNSDIPAPFSAPSFGQERGGSGEAAGGGVRLNSYEESMSMVCEVAALFAAGSEAARTQALEMLQNYDRELGGIGLHSFLDKRMLGVYRPLYYVFLPLRFSSLPQEHGRQIIVSACAYLEELLKRMVRRGIWRLTLSVRRLPLGRLVNEFRKRVKNFPEDLLNELDWLAQRVYNFAKHEFNFEDWPAPPEHYFELDEAIAIYLIVRKLGLELEALSGKSPEALMQE